MQLAYLQENPGKQPFCVVRRKGKMFWLTTQPLHTSIITTEGFVGCHPVSGWGEAECRERALLATRLQGREGRRLPSNNHPCLQGESLMTFQGEILCSRLVGALVLQCFKKELLLGSGLLIYFTEGGERVLSTVSKDGISKWSKFLFIKSDLCLAFVVVRASSECPSRCDLLL